MLQLIFLLYLSGAKIYLPSHNLAGSLFCWILVYTTTFQKISVHNLFGTNMYFITVLLLICRHLHNYCELSYSLTVNCHIHCLQLVSADSKVSINSLFIATLNPYAFIHVCFHVYFFDQVFFLNKN